MPDHPHEGECKTPVSLDETIVVNGGATAEYPNATGGGPRPQPEIIAMIAFYQWCGSMLQANPRTM